MRSAAPRVCVPGATPAPRSLLATIAIINNQSVKTTQCGGPRGYDGGKQVTGRKRHMLVDTMGFLLAILVHPASDSDSQQAPWLLKRLAVHAPRLQVVFADQAYRGTPPSLVARVFGWAWRIVRRSPEQQGVAEPPKQWIA
ncbi:MAG: transposase [Bacteroidetes bacterium]|jgi:putative transposase|nr:transposase [Bacteroidota bacterium]